MIKHISNKYLTKEIVKVPLQEMYNREVFVQITDLQVPGVKDYYVISNFGRIYHRYLGIFIKYGMMTSGYYFAILALKDGQKKQIGVHRLVLMTFNMVPGYESLQVNHKNGNKLDNRLENLEWCSSSYNIRHAYNTGLHPKGENVAYSKITEETAKKIIEYLKMDKYDFNQIAEMTGATVSIVAAIKRKNAWAYLSKDVEFHSRPGRLFTDEDIHKICQYFDSHPKGNKTIKEHSKDALEFVGLPNTEREIDTIRKVYTGKYNKDIVRQYSFWFND